MIEAEWSHSGLGYDDAYFCSLSSKTIIYKGQLTPAQVGAPGRLGALAERAAGRRLRGQTVLPRPVWGLAAPSVQRVRRFETQFQRSRRQCGV